MFSVGGVRVVLETIGQSNIDTEGEEVSMTPPILGLIHWAYIWSMQYNRTRHNHWLGGFTRSI